jgi:hypothetical protein
MPYEVSFKLTGFWPRVSDSEPPVLPPSNPWAEHSETKGSPSQLRVKSCQTHSGCAPECSTTVSNDTVPNRNPGGSMPQKTRPCQSGSSYEAWRTGKPGRKTNRWPQVRHLIWQYTYTSRSGNADPPGNTRKLHNNTVNLVQDICTNRTWNCLYTRGGDKFKLVYILLISPPT